MTSALVWDWEFILWSTKDGGLRKKSHLVTYTELVPWWPQVGFAIEGIG